MADRGPHQGRAAQAPAAGAEQRQEGGDACRAPTWPAPRPGQPMAGGGSEVEIERRNIAIVARRTQLSSNTKPFVGAATSLRLHRPCALAGAVGKDLVEEVLAATLIE